MLKVSLLGEQVIADDATGDIRSRSSRTLALVGHLVVNAGSVCGRQQLAGLFWPDSADAQALTNLRRELHHLRRLLGADGPLEVTATSLRWRDSATCRVDVRVLRTRLERARRCADSEPAAAVALASEGLAVYGGDFLPGVDDEWAIAPREQLRRDCLDLCDLLADLGSRHGDLDVAVAAARRRIVLQPLEEVGYRTLMTLQVEAGDRGGAVSTYHHCAAVLERELGVAPAAETRRAVDALIGRPHAPAGPARAPLVGRAGPLRRLEAQWAATVREGRARVVVVRGLAGVGKTRLVAELAGRVRRGRGVVADAQCFDTSGRLVLAPVAEWLRTPDLRAASRSLEAVWRDEVGRLAPDVLDGPGPAPAPATGDRAKVDAWQRHRFFEGLARAFLAVRRPLLLVLDNVQWCDQETLAWLSFLLRLGGDRPLMVVVTLREDESAPDSAAVGWPGLAGAAVLVDQVALSPLDREDTATLSSAVTGTPLSGDEAALVHATSGGFPLFVIEAARAAGGPEPAGGAGERLGSVLRRRIGETSAPARQTAGLAAALGRDFTLDVLTEASDLAPEEVALAVDELWRRRVVRARGTGYDFSHDLLRDAAYDLVSPPRRWLLHRRLAQALELSAAARDDDHAALLAEQYDRGGRPDRAREYYVRAAEVAAARFAAAEAIRLHRKALAIVTAQAPGRQRDQRELDCLLAMAAPLNASQGYASPQLRTVLERAVALAETTGPNSRLVSALLGLWASRFVQGDTEDSLRVAARALAVSGVDDVRLGEAHFAYAGASLSLGRPAEGVAHFDLAHDRCRGAESLVVGSMPEVHALAWAAHAHWLLGESDRAAERAAEATDRARASAHPYSLAVALAYAAITHQILGRREQTAADVDELMVLSERYGFAYYSEWGLVLGGWLSGGAEGITVIRRGIENLRRQLSLARMPYWLSLLADAQARTGAVAEAAATLDAAHTSASSRGDVWWLPEITRMRAALAVGEHRAELLDAALALAEEQGSRALAERVRADLDSRSGANAVRTPRS